MLKRLIRFWTGDDIFISYSRKDGFQYAANLANRLADNFSCSFDQLASEPGAELPESLKKRLKRSSSLVLVGTRDAAQSRLVLYELEEFRKTRRPIIPILFEGVTLREEKSGARSSLRSCPLGRTYQRDPQALWANHIQGAAITIETTENLSKQIPSPEVMRRISDSCRFLRKEQRQRAATWGAGTVFALLALMILVAGYIAKVQASNASEMTRRAQSAAEEATKQQRLAETKTDEASRAAALAEENNRRADAAANKADEQTRIAHAARQRAIEANALAALQESNARRNLASNFYTQAQVEGLNDPRRAIVWASNALQQAPVNDPLRSLYGLMITHVASEMPGTVINTPSPISTAIFSDTDDRAILFAANGAMVLWDMGNGKIVAPSLNADLGISPDPWRTTFSHDGKWIAALVADLETMKRTKARWHYRLRVWSADTGTLQKDLPIFSKDEPPEVTFSPDGKEIVVFGNGNTYSDDDDARSARMRVWDRARGIEIKFTESFHFGYWTALRNRAFGQRHRIPLSQEPSRSWFLNVPYEHNQSTVEIRNISDGKLVKHFDEQGKIGFADLSPDAKKLVVISYPTDTKAELRIWDVDSGQASEPVPRTLDLNSENSLLSKRGLVEAFPIKAISNDGKKLLFESGGCDALEIWYYVAADNSLLERPLDPDWRQPGLPLRACDSGIEDVFFSDDGEYVVEAHNEDLTLFDRTIKIRVWDTRTRHLITPIRALPQTLGYHFSLSTMQLKVALTNGTLMTSRLLRQGSLLSQTALTLPEDHKLGTIMFTPTRHEILATSYDPLADENTPAQLQLLDAGSGAPKWNKQIINDPYVIKTVTLSSDGSRFVSSTRQKEPDRYMGTPVSWVQRTSDGEVLPGFHGIKGHFSAIRFSRDGTALVSSEFDLLDYQTTIRKWSAASGEAVANFPPVIRHSDFMGFSRFADYYLATSPQNTRNLIVQSVDRPHESTELQFAENGIRELFMYLFETAREVRLARGELELIMDFGVTLTVERSQRGVEILDENSQLLIPTSIDALSPFTLDSAPQIEDISADGTLLAVRTNDHTVRIYENRTGRPVSEPFWHEGNVKLARFSGETDLLTITDRGEERLWHVGQPNWKVPAWMTSLGEAISGFKLVNDIELQRISQPEYANLRESTLKSLRKAAASGDKDAQIVLRNWH